MTSSTSIRYPEPVSDDVRYIHVCRKALEANKKAGALVEPPFVVRYRGEEHPSFTLEFSGVTMGVAGEEPLGGKGGPRVWLETTDPVFVDDGEI